MPKFIKNDEVFVNAKATKEFTDREEPRKIFWEKYNLMKSQMNDETSIQVISYYGFGGIGKTSLLHKLMEELNDRESESKIEFLDFEKLVEFNNNLLDILKVIRHDLKDKYKFTFPIFDLVTYVYETKMGKTATKPELSSIFDENKELGFLKDVISDIPLIVTFAKVIYYADSGKNLIQERLRNQKLRQRLLEIENTSVEEIKEHLAYYFSIDLKENLKNEKAPFVFFIDTYEKLVNELTQIGDPLKNDLWLRSDEGLICRVPNVIWVMAGREKLKWQDLDEGWEGTLEQHLLGTLSFQDTSSFLKTAGINDEELIKQIYSLTHGTPMYLDMCVDAYVKLIDQGKEPTIEEFKGDTTSLVNRFLMYMKDAERDFSTMLAYVPEWTDDSIEEIAMKMNGTFSYSLYEKVKNFSFIVNENGKYKMHESIKDIIIANTPEVLRSKYQRILQETENSKLEKIVENENKKAEELLKTGSKIKLEELEGKEKIANLDRYESKKAYRHLIEKLRIKVKDEKNEAQFNETAKYLLEKLNEYEEKFNETIDLEQIYLVKFKDNKYFKLLQVYKEIDNLIGFHADKYIANYNNWIKQYGENDKYSLFELKHNIRWNTYITDQRAEIKDLFDFVSSKINKDDLYYIAFCSIYVQGETGRQLEFIERIRIYLYNHKPDKFYIKLILRAANLETVDNSLREKYNVWVKDYYEFYDEKYAKEAVKEGVFNFNLAIKTLRENPNLLDETVLKQINGVYKSYNRFFSPNPLNNILFEYIYSIRYIALSTSNQDIIDIFIQILKGFLGGEQNIESEIIHNRHIINKITVFLQELRERCIELYGKDHYYVNEIENYLEKFGDLTPKIFNERIQAKIDKHGIKDEKTIRTFTVYVNEILNKKQKDEEYFIYIYKFAKDFILASNKKEINTFKMEEFISLVKKCLLYLSKEKYYNSIIELDNLLLNSYDENAYVDIAPLIFKDAEDILKIKHEEEKRDKKQTEDAISMVENIIANKYSSNLLPGVIFNYIILKVYCLIEFMKEQLNNEKLISKCEDVKKALKDIDFLFSPTNDFKNLYNDLTGKEKMEKKWDWISLNYYTVAVDQVKYLRNMYKDEFGKNNSNTVLLTACLGLLETLLYIKEGPKIIDEAFSSADSNDISLIEKLNKIKEIEERVLKIYKKYEFKNLDLLDVSLSDVYQKAKRGANLPY